MRGVTNSCPVCGAPVLYRQAPPALADRDWSGRLRTEEFTNPLETQAAATVAEPVVANWAINRRGAKDAENGLSGFRTSIESGTAPATWPLTAAPVADAVPVLADNADVMGRVIAFAQSHTEHPAFDFWKLFTCLIWGLFLLPIVIAVMCIMTLFRRFSMNGVMWFFYMFGNRRPADQIPVWYARVRRLDDESEVMVRLKGLYATGNVAADDLVSFWGRWKDGVLIAKRGFNHRTNSYVAFQRSVWRVYLLLTLGAIAGLFIFGLLHSLGR